MLDRKHSRLPAHATACVLHGSPSIYHGLTMAHRVICHALKRLVLSCLQPTGRSWQCFVSIRARTCADQSRKVSCNIMKRSREAIVKLLVLHSSACVLWEQATRAVCCQTVAQVTSQAFTREQTAACGAPIGQHCHEMPESLTFGIHASLQPQLSDARITVTIEQRACWAGICLQLNAGCNEVCEYKGTHIDCC